MSQENLVLKCLADAQKKLDDAIDRQRALQQGDQPRNATEKDVITTSESSDAPSLNAETTTEKKESVESNEDDDPDDDDENYHDGDTSTTSTTTKPKITTTTVPISASDMIFMILLR